ncbi:MAG: InlB B-repeat-containing protein, partial [Oscillospiraceae bacterium]|nr:InlB B-repeat-containing protein [Oscillospiraceae bacterium]
MRQEELDSKAELVYTALQGRLIQLRAGGTPVSEDDFEHAGGDISILRSGDEKAEEVLPLWSLDEALRRAHWVAEFSTKDSSVSAVFYSESDELADCPDGERYNSLRSGREDRIRDGARVGFYNGSISAPGTEAIGGMSAATLAGRLGDGFTHGAAGTTPYNLRGQSLTSYAYPRLKYQAGMMPHCGDWAAKFQVGGLVYYEQYRVAGRNEYGFYGANAENSTLRDDRTVTGDGYGFVYPLSMLPEERENWPVFSYSFDDGPDEQKKWTPLATEPYRIDGKGTEDGYVVIPLPREVLNEEPASAEGSFYRKIGLRVSVQSGKGGTPDSFGYNAFNPFFVCTAMTLNGWDDPLEEEKEILLRTPRQLYWMSRCYDLFHEAVTDCSFRQELDLDYGQYDWSGFYRADTGMISDEQSRPVHYGSWQKNPQLGRLGLFYWEYETGGANDGYHLSFVGMDESKAFGGSTLCTAHDDGGSIYEYGYGYFVQKVDARSVSSELRGLRCSGGQTHEEDRTEAEGTATVYTLQLSPLRAAKCVAQFDGNGGDGYVEAVPSWDGSLSLPANGFERTGYVFTGWGTQQSAAPGAIFQPGQIYTAGGGQTDLRFYAQWRHEVKLALRYSDSDIREYTVYPGTTVDLPGYTIPTQEANEAIDGWFTENSGDGGDHRSATRYMTKNGYY